MGMIINPYLVQPSGDADAQAFITAAGITDSTQKSAIETLVTDLKTYGIWTKMKALYPFVGGTATTHKYNLKDPQDTDAAFRIIWSGGITHSSNGVQFDGVNGSGDTKFNPSVNSTIDNAHISIYSRTNSDELRVSIGANYTGSQRFVIWLRTGNVTYFPNNSNLPAGISNSDSRGLFINNRVSSSGTRNMIRGTQHNQTITSSATYENSLILIGASNGGYYDNRQHAFASIGDGLTDQNLTDLNTAVVAFQTTLGRNV